MPRVSKFKAPRASRGQHRSPPHDEVTTGPLEVNPFPWFPWWPKVEESHIVFIIVFGMLGAVVLAYLLF